jgi:hypothetical protein
MAVILPQFATFGSSDRRKSDQSCPLSPYSPAIASSMQTAQTSFTESIKAVNLQPALLMESNL